MSNFRSIRWIFSAVLTGLLLMALATSVSASAAGGYGELLRFGGKGTGSTKGHAFELQEETHAFGVDATDNSIYVGDEKEELSEEFRIQKYNAEGAFQAGIVMKPALPKLPEGMSGVENIEGVAVDPKEGRIYVLVAYKRETADTIDPSKGVAGALYAFSTTPAGTELVPATGTGKGGLLASTTVLQANSETQGQALLEPSGITVDPTNDTVLILGEVDQGGAGQHVAIQRVNPNGTLGSRYVDPAEVPSEVGSADSPVVSKSGTIYFEELNHLLQVPADFKSAPVPVFSFTQPEGSVPGPFQEELAQFGYSESLYGGGLAIAPESPTEGRIYADAEVHEVPEENGVDKALVNAAVGLNYTDGSSTKVSELGWTGGKPGAEGVAKSCIIGNGAVAYPMVAAGSGNTVFMLVPSTAEVIKFGPGGAGCPAAKAAGGGLEVTIQGKKVSNVNTTNTVTLSAKVQQANVLSVEWNFGDGQKSTTTALAGVQTQTATVEHKFAQAGKLSVEAVIHTDDLATPELKVITTVNVSEAPKVTKSPSDETVAAGETATFEATASGEPTPTVQWELSTNSGSTWSKIGGATADKLTVSSTTTSENGYQYRALFKNTAGEATSGTATLTVNAEPKAPALTKSPSNQSVVEGSSATFEATASGTPTPTVQWEVSTNHGATWATDPGATSTTLTISATTLSESGNEYRAVFSNGIPPNATSGVATLTVTAKKAPEVQTSPSSQTVTEGESATFKASASGTPTPTAQWEVSTNSGGSWSAISGGTSETLVVSATSTSQSGTQYRAVFSNGVSPNATSGVATLTVKAKVPPPPPPPPPPGGGLGEVLGVTAASPAATLAGTSLSVSTTGAVVIKVSCPTGASTCIGTVTLRTLGAVSAAKKSILTLAAGSFSVTGGQVKTVTLHLSAKARKLLARSHVLRAKATIAAHDPQGQSSTAQTTVTLRPAKPKKHH